MSTVTAVAKPVLSEAVSWRPMLEADLGLVAALEQRIHAAPWTIGNFRDACAAGNLAQVGECDGEIVAYGVLLQGPDEVELLNLSVRPEARREGLGRALLRRLIDEAVGGGAQCMFLEVRVSNAIALALYESEGFVAMARREGYYPPGVPGGAREAAIVMRRTLTPNECSADIGRCVDARVG